MASLEDTDVWSEQQAKQVVDLVKRLRHLGIRSVVFDFDQTVVRQFHSRGHLDQEQVKTAVQHVSPDFKQLVPQLIAEQMALGIATFADARMSLRYPKALTGEVMVRQVLSLTIPKEQVAQFVVAAAYPHNHTGDGRDQCRHLQCQCLDAGGDRHHCGCGQQHAYMQAGKHWHLYKIMQAYNNSSSSNNNNNNGNDSSSNNNHQHNSSSSSSDQNNEQKGDFGKEPLRPEQVILFDDDLDNIKEANRQGFAGVGVDKDVGFNLDSLTSAVQLCEARAQAAKK
jgi:hypothetical protein